VTDWSLTEGFADPSLFQRVRDEVAWTTQMASRQTASMGIPYNYAGASYPEAPWHPAVWALALRVGERCGFTPTNCLLNRYLTGDHSIGYHRDDVDILAPGTPITIVSLGAPRTLLLRHGNTPPFTTTRVPLPPGSLFVMSAAMQADHKHAIKREPGAGERISLTFRHLTHAPPPVTTPRWSRSAT
jgi:alkylated DNA repair dioxygenase AlkB